MARYEKFEDFAPQPSTLALIGTALEIIRDYRQSGLTLTLRDLEDL